MLVLEHNLGKGGAMNAGARAAAGDVLLFLDADLGGPAAELRERERPRRADNLDRLQAYLDHLRAPHFAGRAEYFAHYGSDPDEVTG